MKKKTKKAIMQTFFLGISIIAVLITISILVNRKNPGPVVSEAVLRYQPTVEKYAEEYHIANYVDVLLAMMMQESGGRGNDPMQSSESYCGKVGCIEDPELSIKQGVYYFSETLAAANDDVELAIQSYNFGKGFVQYVKGKNSNFSQEIAIEFSREMYENAKDPSIYSCLREEAKQYNACYGDIYYAESVMKYVEKIAEDRVEISNRK